MPPPPSNIITLPGGRKSRNRAAGSPFSQRQYPTAKTSRWATRQGIRWKSRTAWVLAFEIVVHLVPWTAPGALIFSNLLSFGGTNGASPYSGLVQGSDGNLYGTTYGGGTNGGFGTVFRVSSSGQLTSLYSFGGGVDGAAPYGGLVQAADGQFYGTATSGGTNNQGTVFKWATNGAFAPVVLFNGTNGAKPNAVLVQDPTGNLLGTAAMGGSNFVGMVFQLSPGGGFTNLYSFGSQGYYPYSALARGTDGNYYGTTFEGGTGFNSSGTLFKLTAAGAFSPLYSFTGGDDGAAPYAGLTLGSDGSFYGVTYFGGTNNAGTVFQWATNSGFKSLYSFKGETNGAHPQATLIQGNDGALYGTTVDGGAFTNVEVSGYGTVFKVTTNGALTTLVSFDGTNGAAPHGALIQTLNGTFFGTTSGGGANSNGTIFSLSQPPPPAIQSVILSGGNISLICSTVPGQAYQLQSETNLTQPGWTNAGTPLSVTNSTTTLMVAIGPDRQRFYRLELLP